MRVWYPERRRGRRTAPLKARFDSRLGASFFASSLICRTVTKGGVAWCHPLPFLSGVVYRARPCQFVDRFQASRISRHEYHNGAIIQMDMKQFLTTVTVSEATVAYITDALAKSQTAYGMSILSYLHDNLVDGYVPTMFYGNGSAADKPRHETMNGDVRNIFCDATEKSKATISETYQAVHNHELAAQYFTIEAPDTVGVGIPSRIKVDFKAAVKLFKSGELIFKIDRTKKATPAKTAATSRDSLMGGLDRVVTAITTNTAGEFKVGDKVTPLFGAKGKKGEKVLTTDGETQRTAMLDKAVSVVFAIDPSKLSEGAREACETVARQAAAS